MALGGPQQQTILCVLLVHAGTVVSTDRLIDEVWGDDPPDSARRTLQSSIARLRRALNVETELLQGHPPGYVLDVDASAVDSLAFATIVEEAAPVRSTDPAAAAETLRQGLATWGGRPFDGLADTSPSLYTEAVRLEELRLTAIEQRIECDLSVGRHRELVAELEYLTTEFPLRERFWHELMSALYRCGRQADALRSYQKARHVLATELGIEPGRELQQLEDAILRQDSQLAAGSDAATATIPSGPPQPGQTIRGYELRELVETRPCESVFRAYQPTMGREVAVTAIGPAVANQPEFIRRFDDEVRRIARLEHPHIAPVYDFWRDPTGAFVVSRWMGGMRLRSAIERGPWRWDTALAAVGQVGEALQSAHRRGVAHAHLTSSDVVVDESGNTHVTGFQHSLVALGEACPGNELACSGAQAHRKDTRALGRLLLEVVTGTPGPERDTDRDSWTAHQLARLPGDVPSTVAELMRRAASETDCAFAAPDELVVAIEDVLQARTPPGSRRDERVENPYKGLQPFREADAQDFFGRDDLVDQLVAALAGGSGGRFVAVVGPSGCGKSSAVRAGLVPAVRRGAICGADRWFVVTMVPGRYPFEELAAALMRVAVAPDPGLLELLTSDETGIRRAVNRLLPVDDGDLLIVLDQMEELFTLTDSPTRTEFIAGLVNAVTAPESRVRVVATLRADFYDRPLHHHQLGRLVHDGLVTVIPLTPHELQQAITGPATRVGVAVEPDLVARLIADVADRPGTLPLLQYGLTELFDARDSGPLTLDAYEAIGGIDAALGQRAEEVFGTLPDPARRATRELFLRLVAIGETAQATRSRVSRRTLTTMPYGAAMARAIETFAAARLLELDADPVSGLPTVQVSHEAIFRAWPRLDQWIDSTRGVLHAQRRLAAAVADWADHDRNEDYLATGSRLVEFETLEANTDLGLLPLEREYIAVSRRHRDAVHRRIARRRRAITAALLAAFIVAGVFALVAVAQRRTAETEARVALARELAAESVAALDVDPEVSVLLALEAVDATAKAGEAVLAEAEQALHLAVQANRLTLTIPDATVGAFGPDGMTYAAGDELGAVRVRNLSTGVAQELPEPHDGPVTALTFDPGGDRVISASRDKSAKVWDLRTGAVRTFWGHLDDVLDVAVSADGRLLATTSGDGTARVWDLASGTGDELLVETDATAAVAFDPTGTRLAVANPFRPEVRVIDPLTGATITSLAHASLVGDLVFVGDGSRLGGASRDGTVIVWEVDSGTEAATYNVASLAIDFSSRGDALATAGDDGVVRVWDTTSGLEMLRLPGHRGQVTSVSFHPNGATLASAGVDGTARVWDISPEGGREVATLVGITDPTRLAFSGDSRYLAGAGAGAPGAVIWNTETWTVRHEVDGASDVAVSPDGASFATIAEGGVATVWNTDSGEPLFLLRRDATPSAIDISTAIAFTPDGRLLITGDKVGSVRVWAADSGRAVETMAGTHFGAVGGLEIDAAGRYVLSISSEDVDPPRVWDIATGREVSTPTPMGRAANTPATGPVTAAALSPDGEMVLIGGADGVTRAWRAETAAALDVPIMVGSGTVRAIAYSAAGERIATAGDDGSVRIWDAATGDLLMRWPVHVGGVTDVAFSADGRFLASTGRDGIVRVYLAQVEDLVDLARSRAARALTDDECWRYLHLEACRPTE